jgi:hypothetical protein
MKNLLGVIIIILYFLYISSTIAVEIVDVHWNNQSTIDVIFDKFPLPYDSNKWKMIVDGNAMKMDGGPGTPNAYPNAPEDKATGLLIAADPWAAPLSSVDFPCCGEIQIYTSQGYTNTYHFELADEGCHTHSTKQCSQADEEGTRGEKSYRDDEEQNVVAIVGNPIDAEVFYSLPDTDNWTKYRNKTPCSINLQENLIPGNSIEIKLVKPGYMDYVETITLNGYSQINPQLVHI